MLGCINAGHLGQDPHGPLTSTKRGAVEEEAQTGLRLRTDGHTSHSGLF